MLIMSQSRDSLLNVESTSEIFLSSSFGEYSGGPVKVLASFPVAEDVTANLGEYESEARAKEVLEEIVNEYGKYLKTDGGPLATANFYAPPFAFAPPKVYKMPES